MKALVGLLVVAALAFLVIGLSQGWIDVNRTSDRAGIEVETDELQQAAERAKEEGKELLEETGDTLQDAGERLEESLEEPADASAKPN